VCIYSSRFSIIESGKEIRNWLGYYGAVISDYFINRWFGISAFFIPPFLFIVGFKIVFNKELLRIFSYSVFSIFAGAWLCLLLGYMIFINEGVSEWSFLGGGFGLQLAELSESMFGWGTFLILILSLFVFIIFYFNVTAIPLFLPKDPKPMGNDAILEDDEAVAAAVAAEPSFKEYTDEKDNWPEQKKDEKIAEPVVLVKGPVEPVKPVKEVKLEVEITEPVKEDPSLQ
jgi:S-DNA-T family DNA segregation ATPase FtsK/SpoIIIE